MRGRRLALAAALAALGWGCRGARARDGGPGAPLAEAGMEWKGASCALSKPEADVVTDADAWQALWKRALGKPAPDADFKGHYAVAVFVGAVPTGGYTVDFFAPAQEDGKTLVRYRVNKPGKGSFVIQAFTQPYHIRFFDGDGKDVVVRQEP